MSLTRTCSACNIGYPGGMKANRLVWTLLFVSVWTVAAEESIISATSNAPAETIEQTRAKAEKGDAEAQGQLGVDYYIGRDVPRNNPEAIKWFRKAAEQGNAWAQYDVGTAYYKGEGVAQDYIEAAKWYQRAANQGNAQAQEKLGEMHDRGEGVGKDSAQAFKWYREAAEQGDIAAECNLGVLYDKGEGVAQDYVEAAKWYRKAATQGDLDTAQFNLGVMYYKGQGVPQDYVEAAKCYHKAANQGNAQAQETLGEMYTRGEGVPRNYVAAYKWFNLAAAQGNNNAICNRDEVAKFMTSSQIAKAQQICREFKPGNESNSGDSISVENLIATGAGFFITDDGYLISNYHVVKDTAQVRLVTSAGAIPAKVVQVDAVNDLALLKADGHFVPLPIISSRGMKLGGTVATVGFPDPGLQGFSPKLAKGEIASLSGAADDARYFQISAPVQPGNSGGALVDEKGNVVGIVSAKLDASTALAMSGSLPENVNYAVKSSFLLSFLESVPDVSAKLKSPNTKDEKFEDVVKSAQDATVLVLVY
jgi:TPR repeat protein